jgi:hypothetical protein
MDPLARFNALCCALSRRIAEWPGEGDLDDEIADGFRDEMDWPWRKMTDAERQAAGWDSVAIDDALFGNTVE